MIGSNWPDPLHAQSGFGAPHDTPPFWLIVSAMYGDGQLPEHGLAPYRVVSRKTRDAESVAIAGSQSSAVALIGISPTQPVVPAAAST